MNNTQINNYSDFIGAQSTALKNENNNSSTHYKNRGGSKFSSTMKFSDFN